ncbi:sugar ABC transporter ATP-binding protein [Nocardioides marmoriginsengisoli]|uniref:Sugar ABC transporter ATP-binding protein n=1 Tax=Nocardioides marmoriginsengisoli TaxID=661483 RepID=A0A3N0CHG4_9ACTN|nr:sugar ABC transporter ATP-binding protein [Nocardioides marmoriginsengisoli]RNL62897.1 sugar ABC transporter ATP-binding protein [Nocardioides marmoriginsengisoli]
MTALNASPVPSECLGEVVLEVTGLSKSFVGNAVLQSLNLELRRGEVHALLGENGSGKSTFIKILSGFHEPDPGGLVKIAGSDVPFGDAEESERSGFRFVHQDLGLIESMKVVDNLYLNREFSTRFGTLDLKATRQRARDDLARMGLERISPDATVRDLAPADRSGVAITRALRAGSAHPVNVVVFDEPTATLPDADVQLLLQTIRRVASSGVAVLYVTHRLDEVFEIADNVTILRNGRKVASRPVLGLTRRDIVKFLVGDEFEEARAESDAIEEREAGEAILEVAGLGSESHLDVSFGVRSGEIVGVAGIAGSGRESILGCLFGATRRAHGDVLVKGRPVKAGSPGDSLARGVAYLPPDRKARGAVVSLSARENLALGDPMRHWRFPRIRRSKERDDARAWFKEFGVRPPDALESAFGTFSGGNQQLILLAKWLRTDPALLLLDEPTQGVDVGAKARLHHHLVDAAGAGAAVVVASSDADELAALCHRVLIFSGGRIVATLEGADITPRNISIHSLGSATEDTNS